MSWSYAKFKAYLFSDCLNFGLESENLRQFKTLLSESLGGNCARALRLTAVCPRLDYQPLFEKGARAPPPRVDQTRESGRNRDRAYSFPANRKTLSGFTQVKPVKVYYCTHVKITQFKRNKLHVSHVMSVVL